MKNQIILFTTIKGGTGKTTLCASAATYLVEQGIPVIVLDADVQQSLSRHRHRDLASCIFKDIPWQVQFMNTTDLSAVQKLIETAKSLPCCVLIDCPGNITDSALKCVYGAANVVVVPFELNSDSVDATVLFAEVFKNRFSAKMFFVPNKVSAIFEKRGEIRKAREDAMSALNNKFGVVTPDIKLTTKMNGYSTLEWNNYEKRIAIRDAFEPIFKEIQK